MKQVLINNKNANGRIQSSFEFIYTSEHELSKKVTTDLRKLITKHGLKDHIEIEHRDPHE